MLIIAVAALIIFGPGKLPEVAGQAGRAVRDFRRMTSDLTGEFEKSLNESGAGDLKKTIDKELKGMRGQVESVGKSVERDLNKGGKKGSSSVKAAGKGTGTGTKASSTVKKAASTSPKSGGSTARAVASGSSSSVKKTQPAKTTAAPVELKATKANPLADVSFMDLDEGVEADTSAVTKPRTATPSGGSKGSGAAPSPAIARARERRAGAGYHRARI